MKPPYLMSRAEWEAEREACRADNLQTDFTRSSSSEAIQKFNRLQFLGFGVHDVASQKMRDAVAGKIVLSPDEAEGLIECLQTPISYEDVIEKAKREGLI